MPAPAAKENQLREAAEAAELEAAALRDEAHQLRVAAAELEADLEATREEAAAATEAALEAATAVAAATQMDQQMAEMQEATERAERDTWRAQEELQRVNSKMVRWHAWLGSVGGRPRGVWCRVCACVRVWVGQLAGSSEGGEGPPLQRQCIEGRTVALGLCASWWCWCLRARSSAE